MTSEFLDFVDFAEAPAQISCMPAWKLAVIDDDEAVHDGTAFALKNFSLNGRGMELIGARSGQSGLELLRQHPDTAVVLLDVVMETEDAGLKLARAIRRELGNGLVRIILRTGQPGETPEHRIVVDYDINDYKAKTELTAEKLYVSLTAALRSFEQLKRLDDTRVGLEMIVEAAAALFDDRSLKTLAHGVLIQLNALLGIDSAGILVIRERPGAEHAILASVGSFADGRSVELDFDRLFSEVGEPGRPVRSEGLTRLYVRTGGGAEILVLLDAADELSETQISLVSVFSAKLAVAIDNARLYDELREANADLERRVAARTSELGDANERLQAQTALLRRVNAFKNEILGMIAHDLKNPLAVILGRAEMLSSMARDFEEPAASMLLGQIDHVRKAAQRMTRIVDVSVADALADALDIELSPRNSDLATIARTAIDLSAHLAEAKGQVLTARVPDRLDVFCDPDRIAEAIDNLLSNAVKYAPPGGRIDVEVKAAPGEAIVTVADSGPGLKPEDTTRLFGRFQRLSAQPTGGEASTGLGLSIVRKIVDLHGGRIDVEENGPLGGASFIVALPLPRAKGTA